MPLETASAADALAQATEELGLVFQAGQVAQLLGHLHLLERWNKVYNLTAIRNPSEMLRQHLVDSLSVINPLRMHLSSRSAGKVLDVGSGAGFPGLTIAISEPGLKVICVDSVGKKVSFLRQVLAELGIKNASAEHARIETIPPLDCDVITSRAFASLQDFTRLTEPHLAIDGVWMAMKGRHPDEEIAALPATVEVFHVEQLRPPGLEGERCLIWMRRRQAQIPHG